MLSYIATTRSKSYRGAWPACVDWCRAQVADHPKTVAHILLARAGEKDGRVVAEIASDGARRVHSGRLVPLKKVASWR
jgi:hypothetical protein